MDRLLRTLRNHVSRLNLGLRPKPIAASSQAATPAVFEYVPEGWSKQRNDPKVKGWAVESITAANAAAWPDFSRTVISTAPLAISPEMPPGSAPTLAAQSAMVAFSYAVALAAVGNDQISILDWGGAAGQHALVARTMVPKVSIDYHCVDLESLRALGRELNPDVSFYDPDSPALNRAYDLVVVSGSLQYMEDWRTLAAFLAGASKSFLYAARIPIVEHVPSYVMVQRPYAFGYDTEYLSWCFNRTELLGLVEQSHMRLFREFLGSDAITVKDAPEQCQFRSFLFQRC